MKRELSLGLQILLVLIFTTLTQPAVSNQKTQLVFDPQIRPLIREAIKNSQVEILVEVYKLTDRQVIKDLATAAQQGVVVKVLLCPTQKTNQKAARRLLTAGAKVRWYPISKKNQIMHLKFGVFDQQQLIFGSANWTYWGLTMHHEGVLNILDPATLKKIQIQFNQDWAKSRTNL